MGRRRAGGLCWGAGPVLALVAGCAAGSAAPSTSDDPPPASPEPAAKPQYATRLELLRARDLLRADIRTVRERTDAVLEEIAVLQRDLNPGGVSAAPKPPVRPDPSADFKSPPPEPSADGGPPADPVEQRLRAEIAHLTAKRDAELAEYRNRLRERLTLHNELKRREGPAMPRPPM